MALIQCPECGAMVSDQATSCPKCGSPVRIGGAPFSQQVYQQPAYQQVAQQQTFPKTAPKDEASAGLKVLSFFFPYVGWILYFVFHNEAPAKAKACSKWAWIGVAVSIVLTILLVIIAVALDY